MSRANAVLPIFVALLAGATNAVAGSNPQGNLAQSTNGGGTAQSQSGRAMNIPLLVYVDARGQVRAIQHSQRLPTKVNDLLWQDVKNWTKASAVINGRHEGAQLLMNVTLHAEPQTSGTTNVYFTLASEGPVLRGYWRMFGNHIYGYCSVSGDMTGGYGGKGRWCSSELVTSSSPSP